MLKNAWAIRPRNAATLGILTLLLVATLWAWRVDPLRDSSLRLTDSFVPQEHGSDSLLLVVIDDATLARYGSHESWPRTLDAQAVNQLGEEGARVIVYDIGFADAAEGDDELRAAMERTLVVLPVEGVQSIGASAPPQYETITSPIAQLADAAAGLGSANVFVNKNGVTRNLPAAIGNSAGLSYPALAAVAADRYLRAVKGPMPVVQGGRLRYAGRDAPLDDNSKLRIAFAGNVQQFHSVSFLDVVNGTVPPDVVRGKLVIIGLTAAGAGDYHDTPAGRMAGVTLQANVIDMLLKARFLREVPLAVILPIGLAAAAALFVIMTRWSLLVGAGATLGMAGAFLVAAWLLPLAGRIADPLYVPLLLGISLSGALVWRLASAQSERLFFWSWFRRVAPPEILAELEDGGLDALRGFEAGKLRLRRFLIIDEIGAGSTGVVYKARDQRDGKLVAIKRLYPHLARNHAAVDDVRREARALQALQSPNVVRLIDLVDDESPPFLVMEFVEGMSAEERLERDGPIAPLEAARIVAQAAQGLADAWKSGILHRDVKPANILLSTEGVVKVTDFGLATIDEAESPDATLKEGFVGTLRYASPEAAQRYAQPGSAGRAVDARSDVYSLGLILHELVAGQPAFGGATIFDVLASRAGWVLPSRTPFEGYPELLQILRRCLAEDPDARYQNAEELADALHSLLARGGETR